MASIQSLIHDGFELESKELQILQINRFTSMEFRSTFVTQDIGLRLPDWFVRKYRESVHFSTRYTNPEGAVNHGYYIPGVAEEGFVGFPLSSKRETKASDLPSKFLADLQQVLKEARLEVQQGDEYGEFYESIEIVFFHECSGITCATVTEDVVLHSEPATGSWQPANGADGFHHHGCRCRPRMKFENIEIQLVPWQCPDSKRDAQQRSAR